MISGDDIVWKLLKSESPSAAMCVLIEEPTARSPALLATLDEVAKGKWVVASERIEDVRNFLNQIHSLISAFSQVDSLEQLAAVARAFLYYWLLGFEALVDAIIVDAKRDGDTALAARLEKALAVRREAQRRVDLLNNFAPKSSADLKGSLDLFDPGFLAWLGAISYRVKFFDGDDATASVYDAKIESLEYMRKLIHAFEKEPEKNGEHVVIRRPAAPQEAALWFIPGDEELWKYFKELAEKVRKGELEMDSGVLAAAERSSRESGGEPQWWRDSSYIHSGAAFCALALDLFPDLVPAGLREFRRWLEHPVMARLSLSERLSYSLRYAMALMPNFAALPEWRSDLEDALQLLDDAEPLADGEKHPGLRRDILFTRARIRRELSRWNSSKVTEAIEDFRAGLAVEGGKYDREVRGRAMGDLASALAAAPPGVRPSDSHIIKLYGEAIPLLSDFPMSRATLLLNLAIFYNERAEGTRRENQEQALRYINQAVEALNISEADLEHHSIHVRRLLATLELARGNILRAREPGEPEQRRQFAIQAYHRALKALPAVGFDSQRGEIRLNLGYAHLEGAPDSGEVQRALQHLEEAVSLLLGYPHAHGLAVLARAEAWLCAPYGGAEGWWEQVRAVEGARRMFLERGGLYGAAQAHCRMAELQLFRGADDMVRSRRAVHHVSAAASLFENLGDRYRAIANLEYEADIRVGLSAAEPEDEGEHLRAARRALERAMVYAEDLMMRDDSLAWRTQWSERRASLATRLLWVDASLGREMAELWEMARQAKANDLTRQLAEIELRTRAPETPGGGEPESDTARRLARMYEADFIRSLAQAHPEGDLTTALRDVREATEEYRRELIDLELSAMHVQPRNSTTTMMLAELPPNAIFCDINVSTWGTVVLWGGRGLPLEGVKIVLPLHIGLLKVWLEGDGNEPGWFEAYVGRRKSPVAWREATARLIRNLDENLWAPCLNALGVSLEGARLFISPGSLSGLPLHAGVIGGKRLVDVVEGLAWLPKPELTEGIEAAGRIHNVLCLLSDPNIRGAARLRSAPEEVAKVASTLARVGAAVTVLASVDVSIGRAVFDQRFIPMPSEARIVEQRPTPEWVQEHLHEFDLIFYAGHGQSREDQEPALILVDEAGRDKPLRMFDLLAARVLDRHPLVILSACETALENSGNPGEPFNLALAFLRIGARGAVGTLWVVEDQVAAKLSERLCSELADGREPEVAFVKALQTIAGEDVTAWATFCYWLAPRPAHFGDLRAES